MTDDGIPVVDHGERRLSRRAVKSGITGAVVVLSIVSAAAWWQPGDQTRPEETFADTRYSQRTENVPQPTITAGPEDAEASPTPSPGASATEVPSPDAEGETPTGKATAPPDRTPPTSPAPAPAPPAGTIEYAPGVFLPEAPSVTPVIGYDFSAGDTMADKDGFDWHGTRGVGTVPGTSYQGLEFAFEGTSPGQDAFHETRLEFPPTNPIWLEMRLHVPDNYEHRVETKLQMDPAEVSAWAAGDTVIGADGVSSGTIQAVDADGSVWLRDPDKAIYQTVWEGTITHQPSGSTATSTKKMALASNNKLLALWADDYSSHGMGPTVVWNTWGVNGSGGTQSYHTISYGNGATGTGYGHQGSNILISSADRGRYIDIVFYARFATSQGAKNGVAETYVRREGESSYRLFERRTGMDIDRPIEAGVDADETLWNKAYFIGWSNSGYDEDTTFYVSRFTYWGNNRPDGL